MHTTLPMDWLQPVFDWIEQFFDEYWIYMLVAFVNLLVPFSVWALTGGLRRKLLAGKPVSDIPRVIIIRYPVEPPPHAEPPEPFPPFCEPPEWDHDDDYSD